MSYDPRGRSGTNWATSDERAFLRWLYSRGEVDALLGWLKAAERRHDWCGMKRELLIAEAKQLVAALGVEA